MRMPLPAVAPAMLLIALGFAPRARAVTIYVTSTVQKSAAPAGARYRRPLIRSTCIRTRLSILSMRMVRSISPRHDVARAMTPSFRLNS